MWVSKGVLETSLTGGKTYITRYLGRSNLRVVTNNRQLYKRGTVNDWYTVTKVSITLIVKRKIDERIYQ